MVSVLWRTMTWRFRMSRTLTHWVEYHTTIAKYRFHRRSRKSLWGRDTETEEPEWKWEWRTWVWGGCGCVWYDVVWCGMFTKDGPSSLTVNHLHDPTGLPPHPTMVSQNDNFRGLFVYYQSIKRKLNRRIILVCRCDERLKGKSYYNGIIYFVVYYEWRKLFIMNR